MSIERAGAPAAALWAAAAVGAGCVEELPPLEGTTSLDVELVSPEPNSPSDVLGPDDREMTLRIRALDTRNEVDTGFEGTVDLYAHFLGGLTPSLDDTPLASAELTGGVSDDVTLELPRVHGEAFVWAEHVEGENPTMATGASPSLYYREPYVRDVREPLDEDAPGALEASPLHDKQVTIRGSRHGERGRLVVNGVFSQGYTVEDVECEDAAGTPPCTRGDYDAVFVFTFSRPLDHEGRPIRRGDVVSTISGGVTHFNGLVQFSFPQTLSADEAPDRERLAPPARFDQTWLTSLTELGRVESAPLAVEGAELCPLDEDYDTFEQWKLDVGRGCGDAINVITAERLDEFDPAPYVGEVIPEVVGVLRPINIGNFHVWIIYPRDEDDLTLPEL